MLRFFFLRFLPRRLVPFLMLYEMFQLVRAWRSRGDRTTTRRTVTRRTVTRRI
jgi:hypothetical protein